MESSTADPSLAPGRVPVGVVTGLTLVLVVLVLLPCFMPTTPVRHFDTDPRMDLGLNARGVLTDLGPAGVAWLQALTVAVSVLGLLAAVWAGVRLSRIAMILAGLGIAAAVFHATKTTARWEDWTQAGAWIAAAAAGVSAMHLAQVEAARRWVVALIVAGALPLFAEAAWYVWVEHPSSVAFFEQHRDELLAARGMEPGSEPAVLYERRLRFADATGTFGLSNVLASVAATFGLAGLGVGGSLWFVRPRSPLRWAGSVVSGIAAIAALMVVVLTASKGASVAVAGALGLAILVGLAARWNAAGKLVPIAAMTVVALAFGGVLVRGAMGPSPAPTEGFVAGAEIEGERSLLFRWHYWSAAARIAVDQPLLGSGARGFADAYPAAKNPLNPESVTSAHSVFVDQVAMLGAGGWAWSILMVGWLWRAGRSALRDEDEPGSEINESQGVGRGTVWIAVGAAALLFAPTLVVRQASFYLDSALVWLVAIGAFLAVAAVLGARGVVSPRGQRVALLLAAAVALTHNQIEMAFFQPTSMGLMWLILGAAGAGVMLSASASPSSSSEAEEQPAKLTGVSRIDFGLTAGTGLTLVVILVWLAIGAGRHERMLAGAEAALVRGDVPRAIERLAEAQHAAGLDTNALRWRVQLAAFEPLPHLVSAGGHDLARQLVEQASGWIDEAVASDARPTTVARLYANLWRQWATLSGDEAAYRDAESAYAELAESSPYNIQDRLSWADLAATFDEDDLAKQRYAEVLQLREQKYLDPADPLTPEQLARVQAALTAAPMPTP